MPSVPPVQTPKERQLPALRKNLEFIRGAPTSEGVPTWTIIDPIRNKYFQIEWQVYQLLQRWQCGTIDQLVQAIARDTTACITTEDVEDLVKFLYVNNLTEQSASGQTKDYVEQEAARHQAWWQWLLHHYLFIKIPLAHPHRFLQATLPIVAPFYTATAGWVFLMIGLAGLFLVGRQWDTFLSSFLHFFSWSGALAYGIVLCAVKVVHELGHAYTATRFGCRVPTIGVAFMVLMPVLYSDVSDSYRLHSKRKRLWIAAAGIVAELGLGALATVLWAFLPDGFFRSAAFVMATSSWIMSLTVNLNPLMRFDGYYLLADMLGIPNLQDRAFAFGQWWMREQLFAPGAPQPEQVSASTRRIMITYAWAVWVYRLVLFTGIAVMVYHYFFKLLGMVLFAVEIVMFIALPIWREMAVWWERRLVFAKTGRFAVTAGVVVVLLVLMCLPWTGRVSVPGLLQAKVYATVYAPSPGRIVTVAVGAGQSVQEGETLMVLETPKLVRDTLVAQAQVALLDLRLQRQAGNLDDRAQAQVLTQLLEAKLTEFEGVAEKQQQLILRAPITGVVAGRADSLRPGRWINEKLPLAYILNPQAAVVVALAPVEDINFLAVGQAARFIPNDLTRSASQARITEIREWDEQDFSLPYLASIYGGPVPVRKDSHGRLRAEQSVYRIELDVENPSGPLGQAVTGQVHISSAPQSMLSRIWDRVVAVAVRESGF